MEIKDAIETIRNKVNQLFYLLSICKDDDNPEELKIKIDAKKEVDIFIFIRDILGKYARGELVEVVHCKDCRYSETIKDYIGVRDLHCRLLRGEMVNGCWNSEVKKHQDLSLVLFDGYCDDGERK